MKKLVRYAAPEAAFKIKVNGGWWLWTGGTSRRFVFCSDTGQVLSAGCRNEERTAFLVWEYIHGREPTVLAGMFNITRAAVHAIVVKFGGSTEKKRRKAALAQNVKRTIAEKRARYDASLRRALDLIKYQGFTIQCAALETGVGRSRLASHAKKLGVKRARIRQEASNGMQI